VIPDSAGSPPDLNDDGGLSVEIEGADRMVTQIASDWLAQYARFVRRAPELVAKLGDRSEEFELVPVPTVLLNRLAIPGVMASGTLGGWDADLQRLVDLAEDPDLAGATGADPGAPPPDAAEVIHRMRAAIEGGEVEQLDALISANYLDPDGRGQAEIRATFEQLIRDTSDRTLDLAELQATRPGPAEIRVTGRGHWRSRPAGSGIEGEIDEDVEFEATLSQDAAGRWSIAELTAR